MVFEPAHLAHRGSSVSLNVAALTSRLGVRPIGTRASCLGGCPCSCFGGCPPGYAGRRRPAAAGRARPSLRWCGTAVPLTPQASLAAPTQGAASHMHMSWESRSQRKKLVLGLFERRFLGCWEFWTITGVESSVYQLAGRNRTRAFLATPGAYTRALRVLETLISASRCPEHQRRHWSHARPPDKRIAVIVAARLAARLARPRLNKARAGCR